MEAGEGKAPASLFVYIKMTKYEIITKFGDLTIWTLALGYTPSQGRACSPFRIDHNPSGSYYLSKNGFLRFKDFTTGDNYGCIEAYEKLKKRPYIDIPGEIQEIKVTNPVAPVLRAQPKLKPKPSTSIEVRKGNWTSKRLEYWSQYYIDEDLIREEVIVCKGVDVSKGADEYSMAIDYHCYAYYFSNTNHYKIYQPFNDNFKWFGNTTSYDVYGLNTIEGYDDIIITSSGKDYLVLKSIRDEYDLDYDVIAPNGEGYVIPENSRKKFENTNIYLWYDNDEPGIKSAERHASIYDAKIIVNPEGKPKDPSDWIKENKDEFVSFLTTTFK